MQMNPQLAMLAMMLLPTATQMGFGIYDRIDAKRQQKQAIQYQMLRDTYRNQNIGSSYNGYNEFR